LLGLDGGFRPEAEALAIPVLALSRHLFRAVQFPLSGAKQKSQIQILMSANDPEQTRLCHLPNFDRCA
jgi:hypothetical protein